MVDLHPRTEEFYRQEITTLRESLNDTGTERQRAMEIIRGMIDRIEVFPAEGRGRTELKAHGILAELLSIGEAPFKGVIGGSGRGI